MEYEYFWGETITPKILRIVTEAYAMRREREAKDRDQQNYLLGIYMQGAIANCFSKGGNKYPKQPFLSNMGEAKSTLKRKWSNEETEKYIEELNQKADDDKKG